MKKLILLFVACLFSALTYAQDTVSDDEDLNSDRPGKGDASKIVSQGNYQIETGIQFENDETNFSSDKIWNLPEVTFRAGVFKIAELRLRAQVTHRVLDFTTVTPVENRISDTGLDKIMIGTKIQLLQNEGAKPELALQADFQLPIGDETLKTDKFEPKLRLNFRNQLTDGLSMHYNLGMEWEENKNITESNEYRHIGLYTMAFAYQFTDNFAAFAEAFGEFEKSDMRQSFDAGVIYKVLPNLQLDAYTGFGLSEEAPDLFVSGGVTFRFGN